MILFDLRCAKGHVFEAWFRDNASYESQEKAGSVACPACGSRRVEKAPMAPRIGKGDKGVQATRRKITAEMAEMKRQLRDLRAKVEADCDYVGGRFAEEARRIHHGEAAHRGIYGEATDGEAKELNDEGIDFVRIPWLPRHDS